MEKHTIAFAHRGGRAHAPENTMEAFEGALARGIEGIETDCYVTLDGVPVLSHGDNLKIGFRKKVRITGSVYADLPAGVPTLGHLMKILLPANHLFMDVKGGLIGPVADVIAQYRPGPDPHVWLAHSGYNDSDYRLVASWRAVVPAAILVDSTSVDRMQSHAPRYIGAIRDAGIQCLNLPLGQWNTDLLRLCEAAGLKTMGFGAHSRRDVTRARKLGLDAVHGDNVDYLLKILKQ